MGAKSILNPRSLARFSHCSRVKGICSVVLEDISTQMGHYSGILTQIFVRLRLELRVWWLRYSQEYHLGRDSTVSKSRQVFDAFKGRDVLALRDFCLLGLKPC